MKILRRLALLIVVLGLGLAGWSILVEPAMLKVRHPVIRPADWPAELVPIRIAVLGDLHVGSPMNGLDRLAAVVETTNAQAPDLIVLLGDYVIHGVIGGRFVTPEATAKALARLSAPLGVYAVLGNHDWWLDGPRVRTALTSAGITVLENEARRLEKAGGGFWIVGVGDDMTRHARLADALAASDAAEPTILITHDPAAFFEMPRGPYVGLASHTHGGQVFLPWVGALIVPGRAPRSWAYGHIVDGGRDIYVTAGIGTSILPIRFNMPPEVAIVTIQRKE